MSPECSQDGITVLVCIVFFFKQKTAYEMRISDWSSDVCSSDLLDRRRDALRAARAVNVLDLENRRHGCSSLWKSRCGDEVDAGAPTLRTDATGSSLWKVKTLIAGLCMGIAVAVPDGRGASLPTVAGARHPEGVRLGGRRR